MFKESTKPQYPIVGEKGLPEYYPIPKLEQNTLFYIQRNYNLNTVVYEANRTHTGALNAAYPMNIFWIKYCEDGKQEELNFIQNKLAFGYEAKQINDEAFEFCMVSYKEKPFYLGLDQNDKYRVCCRIAGKMAYLDNIYVFANEFGIFPRVQFIEFYGQEINSESCLYEKLLF